MAELDVSLLINMCFDKNKLNTPNKSDWVEGGEFSEDLKLNRMKSFTTIDGTLYYYTDRYIFNPNTGEVWVNPASNGGDVPLLFGKSITTDKRFIKK